MNDTFGTNMDITNLKALLKNPDTWREGVVIDVWSFVHACFGVSAGILAVLFTFDAPTTFLAVFFIATLWELFEYFVGPKETLQNKIVDVIIGVGVSMLAYAIVGTFVADNFIRIVLCALFIMTTGTLSYYGFKAIK